MKTPMQEMLEYVQDEVQLFGSARQILISKIKEMLEKEKEVIMDAYNNGQQIPPFEYAEHYYNDIFDSVNSSDRAPTQTVK